MRLLESMQLAYEGYAVANYVDQVETDGYRRDWSRLSSTMGSQSTCKED